MSNTFFLVLVALVIAVFFWGIHKLVKTQKKTYLIALLPFVALIGMMFIR